MVTRRPQPAQAQQSTEDLAQAIVRAGYALFRDRTGYPVSQAQRNLEGKSIYAEDGQLKQRNAAITFCSEMEDGLILGIIERIEGKFRPVFFDIFGNVIYQPEMDDAVKSSAKANQQFWQVAEDIDAITVTHQAIDLKINQVSEELRTLENLKKAVAV